MQLSQQPPPAKSRAGSVVKLDHDTYMWFVRYDPDKFWRVCRKVCSCEKGDLRREVDGSVLCGACDSKVRYK